MPYTEVMTSRQENAARCKYRQSPKGRETQRLYSLHYYHTKLKFDPIEKEKRRTANRRNYYREHYGITPEQGDILKANGCDFCGSTKGKMNIDHKHGSSGVRGVLCNRCNLLIGWVELHQNEMEKINSYIERPNK